MPTAVVVEYIDAHRDRVVEGRRLGVEPICAVLKDAGVQIAPSTYYAAKTRPLGPVDQRRGDHAADRAGTPTRRRVRRPQDARRAAPAGPSGAPVHRAAADAHGRAARDQPPGEGSADHGAGQRPGHPLGPVYRAFTATSPNQLWVADLVRHEAPWIRVEVRDLHRRVVAAARSELRAV